MTFSAMAFGSLRETKKPFSPSITISGTPPTLLEPRTCAYPCTAMVTRKEIVTSSSM